MSLDTNKVLSDLQVCYSQLSLRKESGKMTICSSSVCPNGFNWPQNNNLSTYSNPCAEENRLDKL